MTEVEIAQRMKTDFAFFAEKCLKIALTNGEVVPLQLNEAQRRLTKVHSDLQETSEIGAWMIILKARQLGITTWSNAIMYHWLMCGKSGRDERRAYALAQDDVTSLNMSRMIDIYERNLPLPVRRRLRNSGHEHRWDNGSSVRFSTSSTVTGGRGLTNQFVHFTEVGFWKDPDAHFTGSMRGSHKVPGTTVILESTANGATGVWYEMWRAATLGLSHYTPVFLPWYILPAYASPAPSDFVLITEPPNDWILSEQDYAEVHGLTNHQMFWRRREIADGNSRGIDGAAKFAQEYPATPDEAFGATGTESFISPRHVELARRRNPMDFSRAHPLIIGIDPAPAHGDSCTAIVRRRGPVAYAIQRIRGKEYEEQIDIIKEIISREQPALVLIDKASAGGGDHISYRLQQTHLGEGIVRGINFGGKPSNKEKYYNKRAEIYARLAGWLAQEVCIPNEVGEAGQPTLASELLTARLDGANEKIIKLKPKAKVMQELNVPSPDGADALALTFAEREPSNEPTSFVLPMEMNISPFSRSTSW